MPLGTRDILLVIRAKDQASRIIADIGSQFSHLDEESQKAGRHMIKAGTAMVGAGVGLVAMGGEILNFLGSSTKAAVAYQQAAALTLTQIDQVGVSLEQVKSIGKDVASEIPAAFGQMQDALYDIFSSMNVNVDQGKSLLREFSKAAVAGQVDVRTASRATIAFLNAYRLPAEKVNMVNDVMFQLVRKGVGTYQEFADSIGRVIPAAVRTGQEITTMAGAMAFLTRNGLSTEMAATSAARGMELMANPKFVERIDAMGLSVKTASGEYKQINDFVTELGQRLEGLPGPERVKVLTDLMQGAGNNIQARRFWDLALKNFDDLNTLTADMENSSGAMEKAYGIMFDQPQSQMQLFKNNLEIIKTEIGDALIPQLNKWVKVGTKILRWWRALDPDLKTMIVRIVGIVAALSVLVGVILSVVGAFLIVAGAASMLGIGLAALSIWIIAIIAVLALLALAAYYVYKHWDTLGPKFKKFWADLKQWAYDAWVVMQDIWDRVTVVAVKAWKTMQDVWDTVSRFLVNSWHTLQDVWDTVSTFLVNSWHKLQEVWDTVTNIIVAIWHALVAAWQAGIAGIQAAASWFWDTFGPGIMKVFNSMKENIPPIIQAIWETIQHFAQVFQDVYNNIIAPVAHFIISVWKEIYDASVKTFDALWEVWQRVWNLIKPFVQNAMEFIKNIIVVGIKFILEQIQVWGSALASLFKIIWDAITSVIAAAIGIIRGMITLFLAILRGDWGAAWESIKTVLSNVWEIIKALVTAGVASIKLAMQTVIDFLSSAFAAGWRAAQALVQLVMSNLASIVSTACNTIKSVGTGVWNWITAGLQALVNSALGILQGLVNGAIGAVNAIISAYNKIPVAPNIDKIGTVDYTPSKSTSSPKTPISGRFASGAVFMPRPGGTLGVFAEAGSPEAAVPLDDSPDNPLVKALARALQMTGGAGGVTVLLDGEEISYKIVSKALGGPARVRSR